MRRSGCTASQIWTHATQGQFRSHSFQTVRPNPHLLLRVELRVWLASKAGERNALADDGSSGGLHKLHSRVRLVRRAEHHGLRNDASHGSGLQVAQAHNERALELLS